LFVVIDALLERRSVAHAAEIPAVMPTTQMLSRRRRPIKEAIALSIIETSLYAFLLNAHVTYQGKLAHVPGERIYVKPVCFGIYALLPSSHT
jgi:hypothetical protein